jgi:hypothetical protein
MHVSKADLPAQRLDEYEGRWADDGELRVAFESMPAHFPPDPAVFAGLPDDRCQCPHHGYCLSGSFKVDYPDGTEQVVRAGEAYFLYPGHFVQTIEAVELIEWSPVHEHDITMAAIARNVEAAGATAG